MWNYNYVFPSILILIVFAFYFVSIPRVTIRINRLYIRLILVEASVSITDIVSSLADEHYQVFASWQLYAINAAYFVFFFIRSYMFYLGTVDILKPHFLFNTPVRLLISVPACAASLIAIISCHNGMIFRITENGYVRGSYYEPIIYIPAFFYIILSLILVIACTYRTGNLRVCFGTLGINLTLLLGVFLRILFPSYLLMDTFCVIALMIIYLSFTNPYFFFDFRVNVFNVQALFDYVSEIRSYKDKRFLAVAIHNYKELKDVYGSEQMDRGLKLIGEYLRTEYKAFKPFYYREGLFIMVGASDTDIDATIERIRNRFSEPWRAIDTELFLDVDFIRSHKDMTIDSPSRRLDGILAYFNHVRRFSPGEVKYITDSDIDKHERSIKIVKALEKVVDENRTEVYLQPIVNANSRIIIGAEALARITDASGNMIMPGEFILVAERNGMINHIGEQIFKKTCDFISNNDLSGAGVSWININLSPMQFISNSLADSYAQIVRETGVDVKQIHLEITEDSMVDQDLLNRQIKLLEDNGFKFVLDDFGKGYSNLDRLRNLPLINVKIDMSLVWDYCKTPDEMLPGMIRIFKSMGFTVTAEGIENEDMADKMTGLGCDYLQGYLFSKPLPMNEFMDFIKKTN
ncbi:MAG: EAL domain-containing protein [Lachnospiraceae bacterium]|nr:EAL domain-containing protein [Lachnospiraceae bacterium]